MSHTEGLLATNHDRIESKDEHGWINDGWIIAQCQGPDAVANARRLVACWNACHDMSTEDVEELVSLDHGVMRLVVLADDLRKERDELLKALRELREPGRGDLSDISLNMEIESILSRYPEEE